MDGLFKQPGLDKFGSDGEIDSTAEKYQCQRPAGQLEEKIVNSLHDNTFIIEFGGIFFRYRLYHTQKRITMQVF